MADDETLTPATLMGFPVREAGELPTTDLKLGDLGAYDFRPKILREGAVYYPATDMLAIGDILFAVSFLEQFVQAAQEGLIENVSVRMDGNKLVLTKHSYPV